MKSVDYINKCGSILEMSLDEYYFSFFLLTVTVTSSTDHPEIGTQTGWHPIIRLGKWSKLAELKTFCGDCIRQAV